MFSAEHVDDLSAARAQFQDTRDALFLARLLSVLDRRRSSDESLDNIITEVETQNGFRSPVPLVNQTTLLQMAYMTLVYPKQGVIGKVIDNWEPKLEWSRLNVRLDDQNRFGDDANWSELLRTLRNALSHSTVEVSEHSFVFTDEWKGKKVKVEFEWDFLGDLTMEFFHAANKALYDIER